MVDVIKALGGLIGSGTILLVVLAMLDVNPLSDWMEHRERMAKIRAGIDPDRQPERDEAG